MAASIGRCSAHRINRKLAIISRRITRSASNGYYVLLPEIPPDTPESSPIMRTTELPKFNDITYENTVTGCAKLSIEYDTQLGELQEKLRDPSYKKTFNSVFDPIEKISVPLNYAWRTAKHLSYVKKNNGFSQAFLRISPQVDRAKNERWISESLYNSVKEISADSDGLDEYQRRLVDMYLLEARLNGIMLTGNDKKRFIATLKKLSEARTHFKQKVMICTNLFNHTVSDFSMVAEFPRHIVNHMATHKNDPVRGPWKMSLQPAIYQACMEYCGDRITRWNLWNAFNNRAALSHNEQLLGNHKAIEEIRIHRLDMANLLGYNNFASMSMETKMAGSIENVMNMIESLKTAFRDVAAEELTQLQEFAKSEGFYDVLSMWDIPYWRRRQREHLYSVDHGVVAQYFPIDKVLNGLFRLCEDLFSIKILEDTSQVDTWNSDVRFYRVCDAKGDVLGYFYIDLYLRPGEKMEGTWMECGRERSDMYENKPISYWILNLPRPLSADNSPIITLKDVKLVFHEFGHGLQQLLTKVPYIELSGQRNIEWDALQVCSTFMEELLTIPEVVKSISHHQDTGKQIPDDIIQAALSEDSHMATYSLMRQLYYSALDMEMYISKDHWHDIMTRIWKEFIPIPLDKHDNHPCSLTHIFSDLYPAAYYSYKWSEMISAEIFETFFEKGWDNKEKVQTTGKRFVDTYLSLGGAVPASEVFRRFRGRDPTVDALLRKYSKFSSSNTER